MGRRMWRLGIVATVIATTGVIACRQLVGITDNPPEDLVTSICGLPYGTNACASCVDTSCCTESTACAMDPACSAYEGCLGNCNGDPSCRSQCTIDHPVGTSPDVSALSACLAANCDTACGLPCGGVADYLAEPDAAAACQSCFEQAAPCAHARACGTSVDCDAFVRCGLAAHVQFGADCVIASDAGAAFASALVQDWTGTCAAPCGVGSEWACVGHVSWPHPASTAVDLSLSVTDFASHQPISGLSVSVCSGDVPNCSTPVVSGGTTDPTGRIDYTIQNLPDSDGLGLSGYWEISQSQVYGTQLLAWGFPLSTARFSHSGSLASQSVTQELFSAIGITQDPSRGMISAQVFDCDGNPAPNVKITTDINDPLVHETYGISGVTTNTVTDSTGIVIFSNVPVGVATLIASPVALGKPSSNEAVLVEAAAWSYMPMPVTP
ncbi:MAG: carboxypeptidase-like regulatory domain-containing protein [Polyangiaceae bacterium]